VMPDGAQIYQAALSGRILAERPHHKITHRG